MNLPSGQVVVQVVLNRLPRKNAAPAALATRKLILILIQQARNALSVVLARKNRLLIWMTSINGVVVESPPKIRNRNRSAPPVAHVALILILIPNRSPSGQVAKIVLIRSLNPNRNRLAAPAALATRNRKKILLAEVVALNRKKIPRMSASIPKRTLPLGSRASPGSQRRTIGTDPCD
jgi:hypothetical protein